MNYLISSKSKNSMAFKSSEGMKINSESKSDYSPMITFKSEQNPFIPNPFEGRIFRSDKTMPRQTAAISELLNIDYSAEQHKDNRCSEENKNTGKNSHSDVIQEKKSSTDTNSAMNFISSKLANSNKPSFESNNICDLKSDKIIMLPNEVPDEEINIGFKRPSEKNSFQELESLKIGLPLKDFQPEVGVPKNITFDPKKYDPRKFLQIAQPIDSNEISESDSVSENRLFVKFSKERTCNCINNVILIGKREDDHYFLDFFDAYYDFSVHCSSN